jgi:hypothetical protein
VRLSDSFDVWWEGLSEATKSRIDKATARHAYVAGFRRYTAPELKKFKLYAGRRKVTVSARTLEDAKAKAITVLNQRAAAAGLNPPKAGWKLKPAQELV